ncbi:D-alanyl-D-alanine carboxypeptidase/D-alanyl-D-alanine-endopeptidase [Nocardia implantans]|uniref:D-alanyl-D-alanine carboxypeptidase/D-alanyl-D-alanine-endopeptidase n=1 Tax=Nocardia implantans TaxID=3108168 RepID=A0ABU6B2L5_9NOCA|nr:MULTISPECIES: D-alanyl-D-alanine carboxypeptidase/D-alanyl-D-alanine-endopeptidase [unclassified Nocardia]MBF6190313.1 D-alanyl-D-alanine carboxypeptidase/D-alanyl-D-alanine-endopeptidase [Nocardia beijingensis]MEA3531841.1 D-alanyl-D-alanine carboxypeptidase/D-alanyl-D-alanine-endopeptidase [Nocardia sp. CDC192]MEB3514005.1 D-alanyl-D-alanine carboxypeptidase/D-alanyl-D-alanine-endopeptidase [Nocardia sp. CDC186]
MGGLAARRRRNRWLLISAVLVVLAVAAAVTLLAVRPWTDEFRHGGLTIAAPPAPVEPSPQVGPARPAGSAPSPAGVAAALAPVIANPDLGAFAGQVTDADSGTVLWSGDANRPMIPSSTAKILTTAAALLTLPAEHRVTTKVVAGAAPNELVLVGGGDPTLTAQPDGKGYYPNGPRLSELVTQIKAAGRAVDTIVVDLSAYAGPAMAQGWDPIDIPEGSIAPIEPVMIDGGRLQPLVEYSPRTATPALDAGRRLATELGLDPARVKAGVAPAGAAEVASVRSAPLRDRLRDMMVHSDNVLAEAIGREIATATGGEASFSGGVTAVRTALSKAGFDLSGLDMHDSSGLSVDDRIPARLLDRVVATAAGPTAATAVQQTGAKAKPENDRLAATLAPMLDDLPVAGATGSLTSRYVTRDRQAAGWVRAKTGTLSVSSALVGYVLDADGRVLTFALMSNDRPPEVSRPALDAIAGTLRNCGCS